MPVLHIDLETYSSTDIKFGVYKYSASEDFRVLLFAYAMDDDPVRVVDLAQGGVIPEEIRLALTDPSVIKMAHNAAFERVCLSRFLGMPRDQFLPPEQWRCTMVWSLACGLPATLKAVGAALGIEKQKLETGTWGITYFCKPYKGTHKQPSDNPEKWTEFKSYNLRDVEAEKEIADRLEQIYQLPPRDWALYSIDQRINDRGVGVDLGLVNTALKLKDLETERLKDEAAHIAPGLNVKSNVQLLSWLQRHGSDLPNLRKETLEAFRDSDEADPVNRMIMIRKGLSKTALVKYNVLQSATDLGRIRGLFQFYGSRTGRWSGRMFQPQNLPRPKYEDHEKLRPLVKSGDIDAVHESYPDLMEALSSCIRTALIPREGKVFCVADYSAIECRVVAWLADEKWVLQAFKDHKDIYCETAGAMFGVPVVKHGENGHLRSKGKVAVLGCGYGGGIAAIKAMGGERMGMTEEEMQEAVNRWRKANPRIKYLWSEYETKAKTALETPGTQKAPHGVSFTARNGCLYVGLPTGRSLVYQNCRVEKGKIIFNGLEKGHWGRLDTWGGKLVENVTQAVARDCLAAAMTRLEMAGYAVVAHIHDEVVCECSSSEDLEKVTSIMGQPLPWAPGLELRAEGFSGLYYRKD